MANFLHRCCVCGQKFIKGSDWYSKTICSEECQKVKSKKAAERYAKKYKAINKRTVEYKKRSGKVFKYKCEICGKVYEPNPEWRSKHVCSDECKKIRKKLKGREYWDKVKDEVNARKRENTAILIENKPKTRQKKRSADTLADINALAREQGLSYGQMQGLLYAQRNCIIRRRVANER